MIENHVFPSDCLFYISILALWVLTYEFEVNIFYLFEFKFHVDLLKCFEINLMN
jgi:hypothetical protein